MSNDVTKNPWILDSAGATVLGTAKMVVQSIAWVSNSVASKDIEADDDFVLTDQNSRAVVSKRAEAITDGLVISFPNGLQVDGLILPTMDGGICYIYFGSFSRW